MLCIDKMSGSNNLGESEFVYGGDGCIDCDSCDNIFCPDDFLGRGVKTSQVISIGGEEIKETFSTDRGDNL